MIELLGYLAYFLIVGFNAVQWAFMVRGRTVNLGALPMYSLVAGLALLQATLVWPLVFGGFAPPTYVVVGNAVSLVFAALGLERVLRAAPPKKPGYLTLGDGTILEVSRAIPPTLPNLEYQAILQEAEEERRAVLAERVLATGSVDSTFSGKPLVAAPATDTDKPLPGVPERTAPENAPAVEAAAARFKEIGDEGVRRLREVARQPLVIYPPEDAEPTS